MKLELGRSVRSPALAEIRDELACGAALASPH